MSTPQGFKDDADLAVFNKIQAVVAECFDLAGFDEMRTPAAEYSASIGKHMLDELPDSGMFSFKDAKDKWLSLRYDHTAPLARYVNASRKSLQFPFKAWRQGWVWRNELNIRAGRFREFYQMDADIVGSSNPESDASLIRLLLRIFDSLDLNVTVRWSSRTFIDQMLDNVGIAEPERRLAVMRALDKADRQDIDAVRAELAKIVPANADIKIKEQWRTLNGRVQNAVDLLLEFAAAGRHDPDVQNTGFGAYGDLVLLGVSTEDLENTVAKRADPGAVQAGKIILDPALMRGMEYYTGLVFEVVADGFEDFGSVAGGGRYDNLIKGVPCAGLSIGVSRLAAVMRAKMGDGGTRSNIGPVLVYVMDDYGRASRFADELIAAGIRAEVWCGDSAKLGRALAYADRRNSPAAVIQGADEAAAGTVQIKDLALGRTLAENVADNAEWRAGRPGQQEVPVGGMIAAVQKIIKGDE